MTTYTVITKAGFVHVFHIKEMVDIYLAAYGGVVITQHEKVDEPAQKTV